jgi:hypothetical protein
MFSNIKHRNLDLEIKMGDALFAAICLPPAEGATRGGSRRCAAAGGSRLGSSPAGGLGYKPPGVVAGQEVPPGRPGGRRRGPLGMS